MDVGITAVQWVVGKALAAVADGVLEAWDASKNLGLNIEALRKELLVVQATLETASHKETNGPAMNALLQTLRDSAHSAEDLLDEVDYFRIHDQLQKTNDAADQHAMGGAHDLVLNARHTAKAVGKLACSSSCWPAASPGTHGVQDAAKERTSCCAWPRAKHRACGSSSSTPNSNQANEGFNGCMPKLGKLLLCSSFPYVHDDEETPKLGFNRVHVSERMKCIIEELQQVRKEVTTILPSCGPNTVPTIAECRPVTTDRSIEPKLYGRDLIMNTIIRDATKGKYCSNDLTVLPIVGPGGIGKTTLIQHIYRNQEVQNHFDVRIWVCVSLSFNLNKLLEEIKTHIPKVKEEKEGTTEEMIEQRLKSKRFLLVLDDIWGCSDPDDWERLLLPLKTSQETGSMILVTTRFPEIAQMVIYKTSDHPIKLDGLETKEFRKLFLAYVFGNEPIRSDHDLLLETGDKIMQKLKGSPLAAKTVGRLLKTDLNLHHWRSVLESKGWGQQTGPNDIMPALKLSYDFLPFHQQQCFSYSALFPEDHKYSSTELINFWIGLNILQPGGRNQTLEDIGLKNLKNLVTHGFFREEETDGSIHYVMHDLLHDLALEVTSHECLVVHRSNVGSVELHPSIRHLSIIIDEEGGDNADKNFKSELRKLKTRLKVEHLQTLMLFGTLVESFASIFRDLCREANALRVLHLPSLRCLVECILHNFSAPVHLRYLCLWKSFYSNKDLPFAISRFYHLRNLDIKSWIGCRGLPNDMSNLAKLCHFYTQNDELHSDISNVGKLELLQELKVFRVNKENKGFELKQLEHLTRLRELGIYNLEKIHTEEEAAKAKLIEKNCLEKLTLDWDSERASTEPDVEAVVLESLQPHRYLQKLCIKGHRGPSCPRWLGNKLAVDFLQSLHLVGVSWKVFPSLGQIRDLREITLEHIATLKEFVVEQSFCRLTRLELVDLENFEKWVRSQDTHHMFPVLQVLIIKDCRKLQELPFSNHIVCPPDQDRNMDWFPKLQELEIDNCPELLLVACIPWADSLRQVNIKRVKLLEEFEYSKSSYGVSLSITGKDDLHSIDQVLASDILKEVEDLTLEKCPCLELRHVLMLKRSLKSLRLRKCQARVLTGGSGFLVGPVEDQDDVKWELPVKHLLVEDLCGASGKELTEFLTHLTELSSLHIRQQCNSITHLAVGMDLQQTISAAGLEVEQEEKEEDGLLLFPSHFSDSLQILDICISPELVLVDPSISLPPGSGHSNTKTETRGGGLQALRSLKKVNIQLSPKFLSACLSSSPSRHLFPSSLQSLSLITVEGMETLEPLSNLTSLTSLAVQLCGEDLTCEGLAPLLTAGGPLVELTVFGSPRFLFVQDEGEKEQRPQRVSPQSYSSKLQELRTDAAAGLLTASICSLLSSSLTKLELYGTKEVEHFSKEQEDALPLLASLQELKFVLFEKLQHLPAGLHKLPNLKKLELSSCPAVRSLPKDGLPKSLQKLDIWTCSNELKQQCRGLTIPKIML